MQDGPGGRARRRRQLADGEQALVLHAPAGSVADHVMTLVGLPHVADDPAGPGQT